MFMCILITIAFACFRPLLFTVIAGDWDITVDEGTEQTRKVTDIIRVV